MQTYLLSALLLLACFAPAATAIANDQNSTQRQALSAYSDSLPIAARQAVIAPILRLFSAMERADTLGLAAAFHPAARLSSVGSKDGTTQLQHSDIPSFIARLADSPAGDLLEELHYTEVRIDGNLATAWAPYTFIYQGKISHCGTNAFQLSRTGEGGQWQIYSVLDSRYQDGCQPVQSSSAEEKLQILADSWHQAATDANADRYFALLAPDAIFIGTDASEHWTKSAFEAFARPYFDKGKAWDFKASNRHIYVFPDENTAYWDEQLDTWMGPCRGTGIANRQSDGSWLIQHYTLSVAVPNEKIQEFIALVKE